MRGRPEPPLDVCSIEAVWTISGESEVTNTFHVLAPGSWDATYPQLDTLLGDFFFSAVPDLLSILPTDTTLSVLRLETYGSSPSLVQYEPAANVGAVGTSNPLNGAVVLTWRTYRRGAAALGHTFLPLSDAFVETDHQRLKGISWSQCQSAAASFVQHINAIASPDGGVCVFVVVSLSSLGAPRVEGLAIPVELGDASPFIGTLRRRIRSRRPSSSST
jgi:hypothetical protein